MGKTLHIFDLMPYVHAGHVNKAAKFEQTVDNGTTWRTQVTPAGGISLLFNSFYEVLGNVRNTSDIVVCSDRRPTIKCDMLSTYKNNRDHNAVIKVEQAVAEYILQKCNVSLVARAGYEADDIIYSIIQKVHNSYDNIYIYTGDSDLYFLVDEVVSIRPSSSKAKEVNIYNYETVLAKKGARYNTLTVQKILKGDTSDCIPPLPKDQQEILGRVLYNEVMYQYLGNKQFVTDWVASLLPEALHQVQLVFPLDIDDVPTEFKKPDRHMVRNFGAHMNNKFYRGSETDDFDITPYVVEMQNKGYFVEENN